MKSSKKVHFNDLHLVSVCYFTDDEEAKESRRTYWEIVARDRFRFKDRIEHIEDEIRKIFSPRHRQRVYTQRYRQIP